MCDNTDTLVKVISTVYVVLMILIPIIYFLVFAISHLNGKASYKEFIEENFGKSSEKLRNKQEADNPLKLLQKVLDTL